jgi:Ala-tRNA(Pro) deacylase
MNLQDYLRQQRVAFHVLSHPDTFDSLRLAEAVHVPGRMVAKTVLLRLDHGFRFAVAVLPATHLVDLDAVSQMVGGAHTELATEIEIGQRCPDCEFGSLPPFGTMYDLETLLDESLLEAEELVFEGNSHHEAIRMTSIDFLRLESPLFGSFARPRQAVGSGR